MFRTLIASTALALLAGVALAEEAAKNPLMDEAFFTDKTTVAEVQAAFDKGWTLNDRDEYRQNPLHFALEADAPDAVIRFLIDSGAELQPAPGKKGEIAMLAIISRGDLDLVEYAVAHGGDVTVVDDIGEGGLHSLCYAKHFDKALMDYLIAAGGPGNDPLHQNLYGETIAMNVVWSEADNWAEHLDAYMALGADPSGVRSEGWDAFMGAAAYSDNFEIMEKYYSFSADPMARDNEGKDALLMAAGGGIDQKKFDWLVAKGFDPQAADDKGQNALILAATSGKPESLKIWLDQGLDINAQSDKGVTPLLNAMADKNYSSPGMVKALVEAGADVTLADEKGVTPLMSLMGVHLKDPSEEDAKALPDLLPLFLSKGAAWTDVDKDGATVLFYAIQGQQPLDVVAQIIAAGVDVNAVDAQGNTALMLAVLEAGDPAIVEALVKAGADTSVKDVFDDGLIAMADDNAALKDSPVLALLN